MHKSRSAGLLLALMSLWLAGCGGGGGGLGLSGGSVPLGGRAISGMAMLPDTTPLAHAPVSLRSLSSGEILQNSLTDSTGRFAFQDVPTNSDINVIVQPSTANALQAVVPQADPASHPDQPVNNVDVSALSTVVTEAIKIEQDQVPEDAASIVASQTEILTTQAQNASYSQDTQNQVISDPNSLTATALTLIPPTANRELSAFASAPSAASAITTLNGLLGYVRGAHSHKIHLSKANRSAITNAQLAGTQFSAGAVAQALAAAGVQGVIADGVTAASLQERAQLPAFSRLAPGITAFEALVIATDSKANGGFQLNQAALNTFLAQLFHA